IDIGVCEIVYPEDTIYGADIIYVKVAVKNYGDETIAASSINFNVDGLWVISETSVGIIPIGDTLYYTFVVPIELSIGPHEICSWTPGGDADPSNDETCKAVYSSPKIVELGEDEITVCAPYVLDAENPGAGYEWSTGETTQTIVVTASGIYWVVVTPEGSAYPDTDTIFLIIDAAVPETNFTYTEDSLTIHFTNTSTGGTSYYWNFGDGETSVDENPTYTYADFGTYYAELTAINACGSDTKTQTIIFIADAVNDMEASALMIFLYPNPATDMIVITPANNNNKINTIRTWSVTGEEINMPGHLDSAERIVCNTRNITPGIYITQVETESGSINLQWVKE
ncbi:MAG: PKD domain-containing protein, partial [Chitinophagales bacterium]|nr:PKD domain-containing protein [Chitinophagales bacterium]